MTTPLTEQERAELIGMEREDYYGITRHYSEEVGNMDFVSGRFHAALCALARTRLALKQEREAKNVATIQKEGYLAAFYATGAKCPYVKGSDAQVAYTQGRQDGAIARRWQQRKGHTPVAPGAREAVDAARKEAGAVEAPKRECNVRVIAKSGCSEGDIPPDWQG